MKDITIHQNDIDDFGAVLNCAVRYCIGRRTYMPALVTDWIMNNMDCGLTHRTISAMIGDIDEAEKHDNLGAECDAYTWRQFRMWLIAQQQKGVTE